MFFFSMCLQDSTFSHYSHASGILGKDLLDCSSSWFRHCLNLIGSFTTSSSSIQYDLQIMMWIQNSISRIWCCCSSFVSKSIPFACPCPVPIQALHRALYLGRYSILLSHWAIPPISAGVQLGDIHNDSNTCHIRAPESWEYGELFVLRQRDHHHNNNNNNNHSDNDKDNGNDNDKKNKNTTPVTKTSMSAFKPTVDEALLLHQVWGPFNWLHSTLDGRWWLCKKNQKDMWLRYFFPNIRWRLRFLVLACIPF